MKLAFRTNRGSALQATIVAGVAFAISLKLIFCLSENAALCGLYVRASAVDATVDLHDEMPSGPLADPAEADPNESGCVCQGVVVPPTCTLAMQVSQGSPEPLGPARDRRLWNVMYRESPRSAVYALPPPTISGRSLRHRIASLVI